MPTPDPSLKDAPPIDAVASFTAPTPGAALAEPSYPPLVRELVAHLAGQPRASYDPQIAYALSVASTWSYADPQTFAEAMVSLGWNNRAAPGFPGGVAVKTVENDAMLVKTTVSFLQAGAVGILCFRGTEPTNLLQWLADASSTLEPFGTWGNVHSGFYRSLTPVLPFILASLWAATHGDLAPTGTPVLADGLGIQTNVPIPFVQILHPPEAPQKTPLPPMEALYITGHSLGAALAVLAAAVIQEDPRYAFARDKLRGVYTYGQPLIADDQFCTTARNEIGDGLVFRHVFQNDVVPHLPSRDFGTFHTFGTERVSTPKGWAFPEDDARQARTQIAVAVGALAWFTQQLSLTRNHDLPFSIADHMPNNYMGCSRISLGDPSRPAPSP